ncbi:MAG: carbonic anhydrase [Thermogutta sp.]
MVFCTAINCMDGRVQMPVIEYLKDRFQADYVDNVTEPGPDGILGRGIDELLLLSILRRVELSLTKHGSVGLAVVGHADCGGNPSSKEEHHQQIKEAVKLLRRRFSGVTVVGLWVNENWSVEEIVTAEGPC